MYSKFVLLALILISFSMCSRKNVSQKSNSDHTYTNHLIHESSPYLLQHAHNPVDWHPWGPEALKKAEDEDKMLIISIGYAACHWCHVMEHESFEDTLVAKIMNDNFVCIKVDREERPDVDDVYMTACQLITGRGGWPLNAFALADGRPVYAGTYYQKDKWIDVLNHFINLKKTNKQKLVSSAEQITNGIKNQESIDVFTGDRNFTAEKLNSISDAFLNNIDFNKGGRKGSPKFPMPNNYEYLLKYYHLTKNSEALEAVTVTLDNMANGGIYDHVGGGFARYSTDAIWKAPHFEKMLYDNGQLISLYAHAYQLTKDPKYKDIITHTLTFIEREMTNKDGGFYSSLDADSEGEEGKFYVWTDIEIDSIIGNTETSRIYKKYYNVENNGNWEHGNNILYTSIKDMDKFLKKNNISFEDLKSLLKNSNEKLLKARAERIRPGLDDKVLTSWNALMLNGYIDAYSALGDKHYLEIAIKNAQFILNNQKQVDHRLNRNYKDGKSVINGFLDDYALTINAFISLYQVTFDEQWLTEADYLMKYTISHFMDKNTHMFNYTSDIDPPLIARKSELSDNVIPGSNSSIARGLFTLGTLIYNKDYLRISEQMLKNMSDVIENAKQPNFYSNWCQLYLDHVNHPYEVAILGEEYETKRSEMASNYIGNTLLMGGNNEGTMALLKDKLVEGETRIYVCQNKVCKFPVQKVEEAIKLMK